MVGLLAAVGVINLFKTPNQSLKTASQTIQGDGSVQKIAATEIQPGYVCAGINGTCKSPSVCDGPSGRCLIPNETACQDGYSGKDQTCQSGICIRDVCKAEKLELGNSCNNPNDCKSNRCDGGTCKDSGPTSPPTATPTDFPNGRFIIIGDKCVQTPTFARGTIYDSRAECEAALAKQKAQPPPVQSCPPKTGENFSVTPKNKVPGAWLDDCAVDESTPYAVIKFTNIPKLKAKDKGDNKGYKYFYCLKSQVKDCSEDNWEKADVQPDYSFTLEQVCGDGASALKDDCATDGHDWFHAGKIYSVFLAQGKKEGNISASDVFATASFYVNHYYPFIIEPETFQSPAPASGDRRDLNMADIQDRGTQLKVTLEGRNIKGGNNDSDSNTYNDYSVRVLGLDNEYKSAENGCVYIPINGNKGSTIIPLPNISPETFDNPVFLTAGEYVLRIKDGKKGNYKTTNTTCAEGNFTLWDIPFTIGEDRPGKIGIAIRDPRKKEGLPNLTPPPPPPPICFNKDKKDGYCTAIPTALGFIIHTEPERFISDIFTIVLSIGGIAAFGFFIQAGYRLMTSAGDKEKVGQAREQITAAIMGLLFIILSITILEFIGINILHIPGFGR